MFGKQKFSIIVCKKTKGHKSKNCENVYVGGLLFNLARNVYYHWSYNFVTSNKIEGYVRVAIINSKPRYYIKNNHVERLLQLLKLTWKEKRVPIVTDGWSAQTKKPLINFMTTFGNGLMFVKAVHCFVKK